MVIHTNCPYCNDGLNITQSHPPKGPIAVECPSCGKIFEYIHGFGSFDFPREGKGVRADTRLKAVRGEDNIEISYPKLPKILACFTIFFMITSGMISMFISLMPSSSSGFAVLALLVLAIGFIVFILVVIRVIQVN